MPPSPPPVKNFSIVSILLRREVVETELLLLAATEVGLFSWISMTPSKISLKTGSEFKVSRVELRSPSEPTGPATAEVELLEEVFDEDATGADDDDDVFDDDDDLCCR